MSQLLRLNYSRKGLHCIPGDDLIDQGFRSQPFFIKPRDLVDVDLFNAAAMEHDWPRMRPAGWRDQVTHALAAAVVTESAWKDHFHLIKMALCQMDILDGVVPLEEAIIPLEEPTEKFKP